MNLASKRRIVKDMLGVGKDRIWFSEERADDIKAAITREDLRTLIQEGVIKIKQKDGVSRVRARKIAKQKVKGRRKGAGSRKGKPTSRLSRKESWMIKIRSLRKMLVGLRDGGSITQLTYSQMRRKSKSNLFRSRRHAKLFLEDKGLFVKKEKK